MQNKIYEAVRNADMILIGLGEEFEGDRYLRKFPEYEKRVQELKDRSQDWMIPVLNTCFDPEYSEKQKEAFSNLASLVLGKNYFLVSAAANDLIYECGLDKSRIVTPCGGWLQKQCGCQEETAEEDSGIEETTPQELENLKRYLSAKASDTADSVQTSAIEATSAQNPGDEVILGTCSRCGAPFVLNNVYAPNYKEAGYLKQWERYKKWLQGTVNRKLCILELGVGMRFPGMIRFPFEKIAYFNRKATFVRVNATLWQLTEEIHERSLSCHQAAMDFLLECNPDQPAEGTITEEEEGTSNGNDIQ